MFYVCTTKIIYIQNIDPKLFLINIRFLKTYINIYIYKQKIKNRVHFNFYLL